MLKPEDGPAFSLLTPGLDWRPLTTVQGELPPDWRAWFADTGSLTARLKALSGGTFSVTVLSEAWVHIADPNLRQRFGPLHDSHRFWSRQVILKGLASPWVLAHTLLPEFSLCGKLAELRNLRTQPLGEYLFKQPGLRRVDLEVTPVAEAGWARRSLFLVHGKPVMVAENLLPGLLAAATNANHGELDSRRSLP